MRLDQDPQYTRIPGGGRRLLGPVQYWLAPDHLLLVEVVGLVEKYRRFELGQIEAITVRDTTFRIRRLLAAMVTFTIFGALGFFLLISNQAAATNQTGSLMVGGISVAAALLSLGLMVRWLLLGRACEVRLTTSLQAHFLPAVDSRPQAKVFCAAVVAAARRVQAAEFAAGPAEAAPEAPSAPTGAAAAASSLSPHNP